MAPVASKLLCHQLRPSLITLLGFPGFPRSQNWVVVKPRQNVWSGVAGVNHISFMAILSEWADVT